MRLLEETSGEAIQREIPSPRMAGFETGPAGGNTEKVQIDLAKYVKKFWLEMGNEVLMGGVRNGE